MKVICIAGVYIGAVVLMFGLYRYIRILLYMKGQTYEKKSLRNWIHVACLAMVLFFTVGYLIAGAVMVKLPYSSAYWLFSSIFLFGSFFVYLMVRSMGQMSENITRKTFEIIQAMINAMEATDPYTKGHSVHVMYLVDLLYEALPQEKKERVDKAKLCDAALLHDIGKIAIPDHILNKPGRLTEEEMDVIRMHPKLGTEIFGSTSYKKIAEWVLYHHERMDGKGYYGLTPEHIPLEARMLAVADTFSALHTDRVYRQGLSYQKSIKVLQEVAGTQLDRELVDAFCTIDQKDIEQASQKAKVGVCAPTVNELPI